MERVLQNMGNNMGNTVAYFVQIIGIWNFLSIESDDFFSKYNIGSLCILWQKETKLMSIYNTTISVIHWKFIRVRTRKVGLWIENIFLNNYFTQVGECETKNFGFGSWWDIDSFTAWWNGTTNCSTTWFVLFQPNIFYYFIGVPADFTLNVVIDNHPVSFFVHKRPHVDYFLETVSKWFDLVVFTASMEVYGKGLLILLKISCVFSWFLAVCDKLEENKVIFKKRLYRPKKTTVQIRFLVVF